MLVKVKNFLAKSFKIGSPCSLKALLLGLILILLIISSAAFVLLNSKSGTELLSQIVGNNASSLSIREIKSSEALQKLISPYFHFLVNNYYVDGLSIKLEHKVDELPFSNQIYKISRNNIGANKETYESWLECLKTDPVGQAIPDKSRHYVKVEKDVTPTGAYFQNLVLRDDTSLYVSSYHCGYADALYFLRVEKAGKIIRDFTYLFAGARFINISPDRTKVVYTGIKYPERAEYERETFIYDFLNDKVTKLPNISCVGDRFYWLDNDNVASFNFKQDNKLHNIADTKVCIWSRNGDLIKSFEMPIVYFVGYPGGLLFDGTIKMVFSENLAMYLETYNPEVHETLCTFLFEDGDKFRYQYIFRTSPSDQNRCGETTFEPYYSSEGNKRKMIGQTIDLDSYSLFEAMYREQVKADSF